MKDSEKLVIAGVFIVLSFWLAYTSYWTAKLTISLPGIYFTPDPFAPSVLSTTLSVLFLFGGLLLRAIAAIIATVAFAIYYRKGWTGRVRNLFGAFIALEAIYLMSILPTAWIGPEVGDIVLIPEATIPSLFEGIVVSIPLLITAVRLRWPGKAGTAARWACISGVLYIFALWVRFFGQWIATFIQTDLYTYYSYGGFPAHGFSYIIDYPLNMLNFIITAVGLPLIAFYLLIISLPAIRNLGTQIDMRRVGLVLTLLGAYFLISFFLFYAFPAYVGEKSIVKSFFTGHNVDLWMLALPIAGIPLMLRSKNKNKQEE
jgi:hypothetical protein